MLMLKMALKCGDLANPAKPWDLYTQWTDRILQEFFVQGDKEKKLGMKISPSSDRDKDARPKSKATNQGYFIDLLVMPLWKEWIAHHALPIVMCQNECKANRQRWKETLSRIEAEEKLTLADLHPPGAVEPANLSPVAATPVNRRREMRQVAKRRTSR